MPVRAGVYFADEQHVIARRMQCVMTTFEPCGASFDQRRAPLARPMCDARKAVGVWAREAARELDLIVSENIDRVSLCAFEHGQAPRSSSEAPDDERWVE